jgi:hypothetical protein
MKNLLVYLSGAVAAACLVATFTTVAAAADADKGDHAITIADGKLKLRAPDGWKRKKPQSSIIEHEFVVPAAAGDSPDGRVTVMGAGGSVDANVDRWIGQFSQPDGKSTKERATTKKIKAAGEDVHLVDISGTFKDQLGPLAPAVERPKYRMLSAIITTKKSGNYFVKFYGPERTVADNEKAFVTMIERLESK